MKTSHMTISYDGESVAISCDPPMPSEIQAQLLGIAAYMVETGRDRLYDPAMEDK